MSYREPHAPTTPRSGEAMGMRGCEAHADCASDRPGHGLNRVQARLAQATPSRWLDAVVVDTDADGFVHIATLDGAVRRLWHHEPLGEALTAGEPVALHAVYGVLAHGTTRRSVADA
ncbi:hypothetical protein [Agromyces sp. LHK192]|uniref:hypothetical protein n=1 Tax=Agromyces sp. LHK192 TaxID=2498704 RepID=UPI001F0C84E8|nr:hypothetical protein [Agromyces sp. LHK192]